MQPELSVLNTPDDVGPVRDRSRFLVFGSPRIGQEEIDEVVACMRSAWLGTGPRVARFESEFAAYRRASHPVAVNSCTAALHLSLLAARIGPGDEVITTPLTFCATVNAIIHAGATPVLADIDPLTLNIDPKAVRRRISARTRAVIPVHFAGRPCDMDALCALTRQHNIKLIEDCAHAIETEYHGQTAGTFGDFGCFSFYVTKNITTGEGGMVLARREEDAMTLKTLALHGMSRDAWTRFGDEGYKHYAIVAAGFKYNMMDLQAAIGLRQLERVELCWQRRRDIWARYNEAFADLPLQLPAKAEANTRHAYHLYSVLLDKSEAGIGRDDFLAQMTRNNIGVGVHYLSIPEHPFYQKAYGWLPEDTPHAARVGRQTISLPLSAKLNDEDVDDVIRAVRRILGY